MINVPVKSYQKKVPPPTMPKPKAKRYTPDETSELSFPAPPPEAFEEKTEQPLTMNAPSAADENELDKLTELLMKNLENTDDPEFFGKQNKDRPKSLLRINTIAKRICESYITLD